MDLKYFLKDHKKKKVNIFYAATESIRDDNDKPVKWELKHLDSKAVDAIRTDSTTYDEDGNETIADDFMARICAEAVVYPDLRNVELQDSYGVSDPVDLLYALMDNPGEMMRLQTKVSEMNGFDIKLKDKIETAKNS